MADENIGKFVRVLMKDGFAKTGILVARNEKSIIIKFDNGDTEELFLDMIASIKINERGWLHGVRK
jgi:hypothetical protein